MWRITAVIIIIILMIFIFIPFSYLKTSNRKEQDIKQILILSAKVLKNAITRLPPSKEQIAQGYSLKGFSTISIDKELLLREFYDVLYKNCYNQLRFDAVKSKLMAKMLVYPDKFLIADQYDRWSPPYFFTYESGGYQIYLNTKDDTAYYYDHTGHRVEGKQIKDFGLSKEKKNDIIIRKINEVIAQYTYEEGRTTGLRIEIKNPDCVDTEYKIKYGYFNVLEGYTFLVIYAEDVYMGVNTQEFKYSNYNVVGYTLDATGDGSRLSQ